MMVIFTDVSLGLGFSGLRKLTKLEFSRGENDCIHIPKDMFLYLTNSSLQYLDKSMLEIGRSKADFRFLQYLKTLILNDNPSLARGGVTSHSYPLDRLT